MKDIETPKVVNELKAWLIKDIPLCILLTIVIINCIAAVVAYADQIDQFLSSLF